MFWKRGDIRFLKRNGHHTKRREEEEEEDYKEDKEEDVFFEEGAFVVVVYVVVVVSWEEDFAAREKNTRCGKRAEEQNCRNDFVVVESAEWCVV